MVATPAGALRLDARSSTGWAWFVVGGAFLLVPGAVLLCYLDIPAVMWYAASAPSTMAAGFVSLLVFLAPSVILLVVGMLAVAYGSRRRSLA